MATLRTACILADCRKRIPLKRQRRNAITCSERHQKELVRLRKLERDKRICQQCGRPSTEAERRRFRKWRAHEADQHKQLRAAQNPILEAAQAISEHAYVCKEGRRKAKRRRR